jgi:hypothetical protein
MNGRIYSCCKNTISSNYKRVSDNLLSKQFDCDDYKDFLYLSVAIRNPRIIPEKDKLNSTEITQSCLFATVSMTLSARY